MGGPPPRCAGLWPEQAPHLTSHALLQLRKHAEAEAEGALQLTEHVLHALVDVVHAPLKDLHPPETLALQADILQG